MTIPKDLRPEQLRALAYAIKRGTRAPLAEIRSRVASTYAEFEALVEDVPTEVAHARTPVSGWTIQEVVDHLIQSERPAAEQLERLLAGHDVEDPIAAGLQSDDPFARDWKALVHDFRTVHENIVDQLAAATDTIPLEAKAPVEMVVKCEEPDGTKAPVHWIQRFDWKAYSILLHAHNREHISQVHRILEAAGHAG